MKHHILFKFTEKPSEDTASNVFDDIEAIFMPLKETEGITDVCVLRNCIDRDNRYDGMIVITMDKSALDAYDHSAPHKLWKTKYGPLLEKKAIFDCE